LNLEEMKRSELQKRENHFQWAKRGRGVAELAGQELGLTREPQPSFPLMGCTVGPKKEQSEFGNIKK